MRFGSTLSTDKCMLKYSRISVVYLVREPLQVDSRVQLLMAAGHLHCWWAPNPQALGSGRPLNLHSKSEFGDPRMLELRHSDCSKARSSTPPESK